MHAILPSSPVYIPFIVMWVTLALINAALAQGKDRRGWVWFLLSLPFGPLITLALLAVPKVRPRLF